MDKVIPIETNSHFLMYMSNLKETAKIKEENRKLSAELRNVKSSLDLAHKSLRTSIQLGTDLINAEPKPKFLGDETLINALQKIAETDVSSKRAFFASAEMKKIAKEALENA